MFVVPEPDAALAGRGHCVSAEFPAVVRSVSQVAEVSGHCATGALKGWPSGLVGVTRVACMITKPIWSVVGICRWNCASLIVRLPTMTGYGTSACGTTCVSGVML